MDRFYTDDKGLALMRILASTVYELMSLSGLNTMRSIHTRGIGPYSSPEQAEKMTDTGFLLSSCLQRGSGPEFCLSELLTR